MQQLVITLIALLGLMAPVAGKRVAALFARWVPYMAAVGRMEVMQEVMQEVVSSPRQLAVMARRELRVAGADAHDPHQRRMRRAQRASACRYSLA
jgi:hypothetical protein